MNQKSEQQKECAQREPDDKKGRAAADHEDHDPVQDAQNTYDREQNDRC
jgi:hypothetical protein